MKNSDQASYAEIKQLIVEQGLLDKQPFYYACKALILVGMLATSITILMLVSNLWIQMVNAVFLAFAFGQVGFIMHDADHGQIFTSFCRNKICGILAGNLIVGISSGNWTIQHNKHHRAPNYIGIDQDIDIPVFAFSEEQALERRGFARFITKYQAYLWFPLSMFQSFRMRINYIILLWSNRKDSKISPRYVLIEAFCMLVSNALYCAAVFLFLDTWHAVVFILIHHMALGLYMVNTFATNHKGMPLIYEKLDFLQMQVITARNVKGGFIVDILMGGLNYQIEHHLFPTMPRNNLSKAQRVVREYCMKHGIPYHETGFFNSFKEILQHFHEVSKILKPVKSMP